MAHATLPPSGAERWLNCTPSARLEEQFPNVSGEAAAEGTLAHALGELILKRKLGLISRQKYKSELINIEKNSLYSSEMLGYADDYALFVVEQYNEAQAHTKDALILLEQKIDLTSFVPEGFGTGDAIIVADRVMYLIDLKYGKGVEVSAENNKQMMLYALGALDKFDYLYGIDTVRMSIFQPRLNNYSGFEMPVAELRQWAKDDLIPKAKLAFAGEGEYIAGAHCKFCKAKAVCRANAEMNLQLAKYDFQKEELLTDDEIADVLMRASLFKSWINAVEEYALEEAVKGKRWPGHKLVEGRSNRAYIDEKQVADKLLQNGYQEDAIFTKKLLTITNMEKAITKAKFNDLLNPLIVKPPGKPTLVPQSDKRPEYNSAEAAKQDFQNI